MQLSTSEQEPISRVPEVSTRRNVLSNSLWFIDEAVPEVKTVPENLAMVTILDEYRSDMATTPTEEDVPTGVVAPVVNIAEQRELRQLQEQANEVAISAKDTLDRTGTE